MVVEPSPSQPRSISGRIVTVICLVIAISGSVVDHLLGLTNTNLGDLISGVAFFVATCATAAALVLAIGAYSRASRSGAPIQSTRPDRLILYVAIGVAMTYLIFVFGP